MISRVIAIFPAALTVGAAILLFRLLATRIERNTMTGRNAIAVYVLALTFLPAILIFLTAHISFWALQTFPAARWPSWDVAVAYATGFGAVLVYAIAVIAMAVGWRMLAAMANRSSNARAT